MKGRWVWVTVIVVAGAFTGCVGADEDTPPDAGVEEETIPPAENQGPSPSPDAEEAEEAVSDAAPVTRVREFNENGALPYSVGVLPVRAHAGGYTGDFERWWDLEVDGEVTDATITLTWDAEAATTEELVVMFGPTERDGSVTWLRDGFARAEGASPLVLDVEGKQWRTGKYAVAVWWASNTVGPTLPQSFTVDGAITHQVTVDEA